MLGPPFLAQPSLAHMPAADAALHNQHCICNSMSQTKVFAVNAAGMSQSLSMKTQKKSTALDKLPMLHQKKQKWLGKRRSTSMLKLRVTPGGVNIS